MKIEKITAFEFVCRPFDDSFPIRSCVLTIYARDRKEAELIKLSNDHKFFDQDLTVSVREVGDGYRQVVK